MEANSDSKPRLDGYDRQTGGRVAKSWKQELDGVGEAVDAQESRQVAGGDGK